MSKQKTKAGPPTWDQIKTAVEKKDKKICKALGLALGRPRAKQEGVKPDEIVTQIMALAPGDHVMVGPLLLDLSEKL